MSVECLCNAWQCSESAWAFVSKIKLVIHYYSPYYFYSTVKIITALPYLSASSVHSRTQAASSLHKADHFRNNELADVLPVIIITEDLHQSALQKLYEFISKQCWQLSVETSFSKLLLLSLQSENIHCWSTVIEGDFACFIKDLSPSIVHKQQLEWRFTQLKQSITFKLEWKY